MEPRFTFDRVASLYDAARAGYPDELFSLIASFVAPGASVLEVGCGTGKATVGLVAHGLKIVALDPGPSMIAQASANIGTDEDVRFVQSTFEAWRADTAAFDVIVAAQAWHWVPPEIGAAKAASLLKPEGVLAIFGNDWTLANPDLSAAVDAVYRRLAPELRDSPLGFWYRADGPLPLTIDTSGLFRDLQYQSFPWSRTPDVESYLGMLRTLSNHQGLEPARLEVLMSALDGCVRSKGTTVELSYVTHLHYCRHL